MRFQKLSAQYEAEQDEIRKLATALENEIENESGQIAAVGHFLELVKKYSGTIRILLYKPKLPTDRKTRHEQIMPGRLKN